MTYRAHRTIEEATAVVGYSRYIQLIADLVEGKKVLDTGMTQEIDRCRAALEEAAAGENVVVISSGDAGIYGMAGLVLELLMKMDEDQRPEFGGVIPGVSAMSAAAGLLGAPIMHDFAVISLSDLLTPWELIKKRAKAAAEADFVVALYNPKSKKRVQNIEEIREIFLACRAADTPVGIVNHAAREAESKTISTLENFTKETIDMFSLVIIGNSRTYVKEGYMITPRGYEV